MLSLHTYDLCSILILQRSIDFMCALYNIQFTFSPDIHTDTLLSENQFKGLNIENDRDLNGNSIFRVFGKWTIEFYLFLHQINSVYCYDAFIWMKIYNNLIPLASFYNWRAFFILWLPRHIHFAFSCVSFHISLLKFHPNNMQNTSFLLIHHLSPLRSLESTRYLFLTYSFPWQKIFALFLLENEAKNYNLI